MADVKINIKTEGTEESAGKFKQLQSQIQALGAPLQGIASRAKAMSTAMSNAASQGVTRLTSTFSSLGGAIGKIPSASNSFKNSLDASNKSSKEASFSMGHMIARSLALVTVLGLAFKAVELLGAGFKKAFNAVESYTKQVAGLTAVTLTFIKTEGAESLPDQYLRARDYAKGLYSVIQDVAAETLLTGEQAALMARTFLENGVAINYYNKEQVQGFKSIANALAIVTEGQAKERQIRSEINNLLKGQIRPTEALGTLLKNINPNIEDQLKLWVRQGTVIENVAKLLKGFDATTKDIAVTWEAVSTTISTTADRVLRGSFQPVYKDILALAERFNKYLIENKDIIELRLLSAYTSFKEAVKTTIPLFTGVFSIVKSIYTVIESFGPLLKQTLSMLSSVAEKTAWLIDKATLPLRRGDLISRAEQLKDALQTNDQISAGSLEESLKSLPATLRDSLKAEDIAKLIEAGFIKSKKVAVEQLKEIPTLGIAGNVEYLKVTDDLIKKYKEGGVDSLRIFEALSVEAGTLTTYLRLMETSPETMKSFAEEAKKAGVAFSQIDLARVLNQIPELQDMSAKSFGKIAKDIKKTFEPSKEKGRTFDIKYSLSEQGQKKLIPDLNTPSTNKEAEKLAKKSLKLFDELTEKIEIKSAAAFDKLRLESESRAGKIWDAFLGLDPATQKEKRGELWRVLNQNAELVIEGQAKLLSEVDRELSESKERIAGLGLTGIEGETFKLEEKLDKDIQALNKGLLEKEKIFEKEHVMYKKSAIAVIAETHALEKEKNRQLKVLQEAQDRRLKIEARALQTSFAELVPASGVSAGVRAINNDYDALIDKYDEYILKLDEFIPKHSTLYEEQKATLEQETELVRQEKEKQVKFYETVGMTVKELSDSMKSAFMDFFDVTGQKFLDFKSLALSVLTDIYNKMIETKIVSPLVNALASIDWSGMFDTSTTTSTTPVSGDGTNTGISNTGSGPGYGFSANERHSGGIIPRYHSGGLRNDERLTVSKVGERFITEEQNAWLTNQASSKQQQPVVNMEINIENQTDKGVTAEQSDMKFDGEKMIVGIILKNYNEGGPIRNMVQAGGAR